MEHLTPAQEHHVDGNNDDDDDDPNVVRYHPLTPPPHHLYNHSWMDHRNDLHHHMDTDHSNNNNTHSYNTHKDQALLLDMHILQTLLHRNRSSHGRTLYYRRTKMALRQVHRTLFQSSSSSSNVTTSNHTHTLFHEWNQYYQNQLQQQIIRPLQKLQNATKHDDVIQPIIEKIFMEFTLPSSTTSTATITTTTTTSNQTQNIHNNRMLHRILYDITDCIGRIEYAYSAGRMEIARGFFLSILTIWMASLARIHVLLLQLQYTVIRQYAQYCSQQLRPAIQWIHNNSKNTMHSTITCSSIISNSRSNSSSANIPTLLEQVNYLQHDIFQPILSRIHQKLTRYQHSKAIQQQQQISSRTRPERTHSSLQSLGLVRASRQRPGHRRTRGTNPLATVSDHDAVTVPVIAATTTTFASAATTLPSNNNDNDNNSNTNHEHEFDDDDDDEMDTMTAAHTFYPPIPGTKEPSFSTDNDAIRDDDDDDDDDIGILQYGSRHYDDNKRNHTDRTTGIGIDEWSSLDQNMKAVQQFQNQKKLRPKKPSRSDQKPSAVVAATPPHRRPSQPTKATTTTTTTTTTTKKKRKRNRTGNDFFDELFRG